MRQAAKVALVMLGLAVMIYVAVCVGLFFAQRSMIYYPQPRSDTRDSALMTLRTTAGMVKVSEYEMAGPDALIYFGGNAEDVSRDMPHLKEEFPGYSIYLMHYPGYGGSAGSPNEKDILVDAVALFDQVHEQHPDVAMIGRSLGSGVAIHVASERPVKRLVLVTPFDSLGDVAAVNYPFLPVRLLLRDRYESFRYAPLVKAPTAIVAAGEDEVVPRASTERLRTRFKTGVMSYVVIAGVGHNSISDDPEYWNLLKGK